MTWNSACSIASDDESRHSFLSECGSEFDLRPQPRYPAEKRNYTASNKYSINRTEPPMTRSRAKAIGKILITPEPIPKQRRRSGLRRSADAFAELSTTLTNSLNDNSILFPKQEPANHRGLNLPLDGVTILADRFESCSLDEGKLNKNCVWPSLETNSHYMRPIISPTPSTQFGTTSFSSSNNSPLFTQSTSSSSFGQQQAQLWSRFRFAASNLRNNLWLSQTETNQQQIPTNLFTPNNINLNHNNPFNLSAQSVKLLPSQITPTGLSTFEDRTSDLIKETSYPVLRQRKIISTNDSAPMVSIRKDDSFNKLPSISKILFMFIIFSAGIILGYLLTNTLPPGLVWDISVKYFHVLCVCLQTVMKYFRFI